MAWITVNSYDGKSASGNSVAQAQKNLDDKISRGW